MLTKSQVLKAGSFDKGGRYTFDEEFETETSRKIRRPSRAYPWSEYKHAFTKKYFDSLSLEQKSKLGV